jgi:hypothetical protein
MSITDLIDAFRASSTMEQVIAVAVLILLAVTLLRKFIKLAIFVTLLLLTIFAMIALA